MGEHTGDLPLSTLKATTSDIHSETPRHQVRDGAGERESMEILRGETMGPAEIFHTFQTGRSRQSVMFQ
jgi:hypothetical protein